MKTIKLNCTKCGITLTEDNRHPNRNVCHNCVKKYKKEYEIKNKEKLSLQNKEYRKTQKEKQSKYMKEYQKINKKTLNEYCRQYYKNNKAKLKIKQREYAEKNKEAIKIREREKQRILMKTNINYKLTSLLRCRINIALKRIDAKKGNHTTELIGCTVSELKLYLENKFVEGMTWGNLGRSKIGQHNWQIDHIIPCSYFNLTDVEEQKKCFHYTNMQPIWWEDNLKKGNSIV